MAESHVLFGLLPPTVNLRVPRGGYYAEQTNSKRTLTMDLACTYDIIKFD